ncbi:Uncharacterised protein [Bordetella pertussis]|nr:Uncharacterised protein [Bordetella pertussis]
MERCARENGEAWVSSSRKYWRISGRMSSNRKRRLPRTG